MVLLLLAACSTPPVEPADGEIDGGFDGGVDGGVVEVDASDAGLIDAPRDDRDAGVPELYEPLVVTGCERRSESLRYVSGSGLGLDFVAPWVSEEVPAKRDHHVGGGAAVIDVTGDDWPDLVLTAVHGSPALYVADGRGSYASRDAGFEDLEHTLSAYALDLDADGLRDVVFTTWDGVHAFRNVGDGSFVAERTLHAASPDERPTFVAWTDFDGDGFVDAFIGVGPTCFRHADWTNCGASDRLLKGRGGFDFDDVTDRLGSTDDRMGLALAGSWMDVDDDGDLDLLVANDAGAYNVANRLYLNPGRDAEPDAPFVESSDAFGLGAGMAGMGTAFGDVDHDGGMLIAVTDLRAVRLFSAPPASRSFSEAFLVPTFSTVPLTPGFAPAAWAVEMEDLDHDGDQDLLVAWSWLFPSWWWEDLREETLAEQLTPHVPTLWIRREGVFSERSELLDALPSSWTWRGAMPVDLNRDGALDLVFTSMMGPVGALMGECSENGWLEVQLRQDGGNPDALGALVEAESSFGRQRRRIGLGSTGAHSGREPVAHFGLADDTEVDLSVTWPDGEVQVIGRVARDQRIRITR